MSDLSSLLAPIRERETAAATKQVSEAAFGDVLRIIWTTYYFGADLKWHNARTGHMEDAETLMQEIEASSGDWAWLESSNDRTRLLSALDAVDKLAEQWQENFPYKAETIRAAVTAALGEQA
jgi:hypothetical protein